MSRIVEVPQPYNFDEIVATKGVGYKPDFRILTAGIESDRTNASLVHMIGSSTEKDLQGDTMSLYALNSMTKAAPNLTVWLNHNYDLPDSMFGSIIRTPAITHTAGVADLHLDVDVELENPAAARVKRYIDNGRRLGCSIGCMVTKYEVSEDVDMDELSIFDAVPITIHDVYVVEYSVVGIPANQRSWVENAIRGVFQRTLDPNLASAMKGLWPSQYRDTIKAANGVISKAHMKQLEGAKPRKRPDTRLDWMTETKSFVLTHKGVQKTLSRDEVENAVKGSVVDMTDTQPSFEMRDIDVEEVKDGIPNEIDPNLAEGTGEPDNLDGPWDDEKSIVLHKDALTHDPMNGMHTHTHEPFGYKGLDPHHHTHTHKYDNNHNHDHAIALGEEKNMDPTKTAGLEDEQDAVITSIESEKAEDTEVPTQKEEAPTLDPMRLTFLASYNSFGKTLGLPEVTAEMLVRGEHPALATKDMEPAMLQQLQSIHDTVANASNGLVCANAGNVQDTANQASEQAGNDVSQQMNVMNSLSANMALFARTFDGFDALATKKELEDAASLMVAMKKELGTLTTEVDRVRTTLSALKNMPLGKPTNQTRSTHPEDSIATHDDMSNITDSQKAAEPIAHDSLSQAKALTAVKQVQGGAGRTMTVRHWPDGVGGSVEKGVRPALTAKEIQFMTWEDIVNYRAGREATVPCFDAQVSE